MSFDPAVAVIGTQLVGNATQALQTSAATAPSVAGLAPAGAEEVSAQAAAAFVAEAATMLALFDAAHAELARTGNTLVDIARIYAETDAAAASRVAAIQPPAGRRFAG
jgi:phage-related tail protein